MALNIVDFIDNQNDDGELFIRRIDSKLTMDISKNQILDDDDWIDLVNFTIPHLEKAFEKWNRNIITEEEIVKIELIKKVSVESIKHLAKNTNLISEWDQETGDVTPSKILNAYKEENFVTYENRFLFSLVKLIDDVIYLRTREDEEGNKGFKGKNYQKAVYEATTKVDREKVKINFEYVSEAVEEQEKSRENEEKIEELKKGMAMIKATELYKHLKTKKFTLVKSPLKMTNVLLKNVHFQYCVKLWQYLNSHLDAQSKSIKAQKDYEEKGEIKDLIDEDFFIKYLVFNSINIQGSPTSKKLKNVIRDEKEKKELTDRLIEKLVQLNPEMPDQELKKMVMDKYIMYKMKRDISLKPLEDTFRKHIDAYLQNIEKLRLR